MKGKKKKKPVLLLFTLLFITAGIIASGGFYYIYRSGSETANPLFEEQFRTTSRLSVLISSIDNALYEVFYKEGIKEINVVFSEVVPRHKDDADWDFTSMSVILPDPDSAGKLKKNIKERISRISSDISVISKTDSEIGIIFNIHVLDHHTHKIILGHKGQKAVKAKAVPEVAIIIDDIGYDYSLALDFMDLDIPVSLSVLPDSPYADRVASKAGEKGVELLLHLPMEPKGYPDIDPGPDALLVSMDRETIHKTVKDAINKVKGIKGVNHHMGSLFSENYEKMKHVLDEIKRYDLFYVDSRTTNRTVAFKLSKALGIPAAKKDLFIDNDLSEKALSYQMERLLGIARFKGKAIGIGHPHKETCEILRTYSRVLNENFKVVNVSELVEK